MYQLKFKKFHIILLSGIAIMTLSTCSLKKEEMSVNEKTPMVICFDVEDYTSPESAGMDDIPKWLAEIMTDEGVTGSFFVIGEKARMMEKRGRKDVIEAMARHDIGSHTNFGSIHPTVTEILEHASWELGTEEMLKNGVKALKELDSEKEHIKQENNQLKELLLEQTKEISVLKKNINSL